MLDDEPMEEAPVDEAEYEFEFPEEKEDSTPPTSPLLRTIDLQSVSKPSRGLYLPQRWPLSLS